MFFVTAELNIPISKNIVHQASAPVRTCTAISYFALLADLMRRRFKKNRFLLLKIKTRIISFNIGLYVMLQA